MTEPTLSTEIEHRIYVQRVLSVFVQSSGNRIRSYLVVLFLGIVLYAANVPLSHIVVWAVLSSQPNFGLLALELKFKRAKQTFENATRWLNVRMALISLTGVLWASSAFLMTEPDRVIWELMFFIINSTVVTVATVTYAASPRLYVALCLSTMGVLTVSFLRIPDGMHVLLIAMSITWQLVVLKKAFDMSKASIEAIRLNELLIYEVEQRKAAEQDTRIAHEETERVSSAKSSFLANMSHELRTPLNSIIGFTDVLLSGVGGKLVEKQVEYLTDIKNAGSYLQGLINDVLDISKIEAGKLEIEEGEIDIAEQIERCLPFVREQAQKARVSLEMEISPELALLSGDQRLFRQMLVNLWTNAVKFTPQNGRVTVRAAINEQGELAISVIDTGIGISPEDIPKALAIYEQTESGKNKEGTGLGVPLARRMAELHGGRLELESEVDKGTTATIIFPAHRLSGHPAENQAAVEEENPS